MLLLNGHRRGEPPGGIARGRQESGEARERGANAEERGGGGESFFSWTTTTKPSVGALHFFTLSQPRSWSSLSVLTRTQWCIVLFSSVTAGCEGEKRRARAGTRGEEAALSMLSRETRKKKKGKGLSLTQRFLARTLPLVALSHSQLHRRRGGTEAVPRGW